MSIHSTGDSITVPNSAGNFCQIHSGDAKISLTNDGLVTTFYTRDVHLPFVTSVATEVEVLEGWCDMQLYTSGNPGDRAYSAPNTTAHGGETINAAAGDLAVSGSGRARIITERVPAGSNVPNIRETIVEANVDLDSLHYPFSFEPNTTDSSTFVTIELIGNNSYLSYNS